VALLAAEGEPLGWASIVTPIGFLALLIGFPLCVLIVSVLLWRSGERPLPASQTRPEAPAS
jgi:hypothetical protein